MNKFLNSITVFSTGMSTVDWVWRIITILFISGSGATTAILAADAPFFRDFGKVGWIIIGLMCALAITLIFYLIKLADSKSAHAEYTRSVSQPKNHINPLQDSFRDQIIPIEELRVPGVQVHENKHFKGCSFVGPGAIALMGGSYLSTNFNDTGDLIPLPENTWLTGIIVLKNCTVENCSFYRTTLMVNEQQAKEMVKFVQGLKIAGQ